MAIVENRMWGHFFTAVTTVGGRIGVKSWSTPSHTGSVKKRITVLTLQAGSADGCFYGHETSESGVIASVVEKTIGHGRRCCARTHTASTHETQLALAWNTRGALGVEGASAAAAGRETLSAARGRARHLELSGWTTSHTNLDTVQHEARIAVHADSEGVVAHVAVGRTRLADSVVVGELT